YGAAGRPGATEHGANRGRERGRRIKRRPRSPRHVLIGAYEQRTAGGDLAHRRPVLLGIREVSTGDQAPERQPANPGDGLGPRRPLGSRQHGEPVAGEEVEHRQTLTGARYPRVRETRPARGVGTKSRTGFAPRGLPEPRSHTTRTLGVHVTARDALEVREPGLAVRAGSEPRVCHGVSFRRIRLGG